MRHFLLAYALHVFLFTLLDASSFKRIDSPIQKWLAVLIDTVTYLLRDNMVYFDSMTCLIGTSLPKYKRRIYIQLMCKCFGYYLDNNIYIFFLSCFLLNNKEKFTRMILLDAFLCFNKHVSIDF